MNQDGIARLKEVLRLYYGGGMNVIDISTAPATISWDRFQQLLRTDSVLQMIKARLELLTYRVDEGEEE